MENKLNDLIDRIKIFLKSNTYIYIQDIFNYHFNGYIIKVDNEKVIFKDDELGEIPIRLLDIIKLTYSTKNK